MILAEVSIEKGKILYDKNGTIKRKVIMTRSDFNRLKKRKVMEYQEFDLFETIPSVFTDDSQIKTFIEYELGFDLESIKQVAI